MKITKEHKFRSGSKATLFFESLGSDPLSEEVLDKILDLKIMGPLTAQMSPSSPRYREFLLSRKLILEAIAFSRQKNVGGMCLSLSHTQSAAIVVTQGTLAFEGVSLACGMGVDLEALKRNMSPAAAQRLHQSDLDKKIPALDLWLLKESVFKAHPQNENLLLSDFFVSQLYTTSSFELVCDKSQKKFEADLIEIDEYKVALAKMF